MDTCLKKRIYELIITDNPELSDRVDHLDIDTGDKICSARVWLIGQELPVYFIFDIIGDELQLSHGVDFGWTEK